MAITVGELIGLLQGQPFDLPVLVLTGGGTPLPVTGIAPAMQSGTTDESPHGGQGVVLRTGTA